MTPPGRAMLLPRSRSEQNVLSEWTFPVRVQRWLVELSRDWLFPAQHSAAASWQECEVSQGGNTDTMETGRAFFHQTAVSLAGGSLSRLQKQGPEADAVHRESAAERRVSPSCQTAEPATTGYL